MDLKQLDGRQFSDEEVDWKDIRVGDVVIEGYGKPAQYRTLTAVDGKYWEYFRNGFYSSTSPEFCHWLVDGQAWCSDSKLKRIRYEKG